jgi:hypothetical protein
MDINRDERNENWSALLRALYEHETAGIKYPTGGGVTRYVAEDNQFIQQKTSLTPDEANKAVEYLLEVGLLTRGGDQQHVMSDEGFQVAHQRWIQEQEDQRIREQEKNENKRARRQHEVNRAIAFLSLGLLVVTVIDSATRVFVGMESYTKGFLAVGSGLFFILVFTALMYTFGLLSKDPVD